MSINPINPLRVFAANIFDTRVAEFSICLFLKHCRNNAGEIPSNIPTFRERAFKKIIS